MIGRRTVGMLRNRNLGLHCGGSHHTREKVLKIVIASVVKAMI